MGFCPFHHNVNTPSFVIFPDGGWKCFGECNEGGDILTFVMKQEKLGFTDALELLAVKAGIEIGSSSKIDPVIWKKWTGLYKDAYDYFYENLYLNPGEPTRNYLRNRYPGGEWEKHDFRVNIGYAPRSGLYSYLINRGHESDFVFESGLVCINPNGYHDFFRDRLMIPIRDAQGTIIAFAGRVIGECPPGVPKFINSPNTPIFEKSSTWFGQNAPRFDQVVIVEGYFDVLVAHVHDMHHVMSPMGIAISESHFQQLAKITDRAVLALDPDKAGIQAIGRSIKTAESLQETQVELDWRGFFQMQSRTKLDIRVAELPDGKDPDELIIADVEKWRGLIDQAISAPDYVIKTAIAGKDLSDLEVKKEVIHAVMPTLAGIKDEISRSFYMQHLVDLTGISEDVLKRSVAKKELPASQPNQNRFYEIEKNILALLLSFEVARDWVNRNLALARMPEFTPDDFENAEFRQIAEVYWESIDQLDLAWWDYLTANISAPLFQIVADSVPSVKSGEEKATEKAVGEILRSLLVLRQERGKQRLTYLISLQKQGSPEAAKDILALNQSRGKIEKALTYFMDFRKKNNLEINHENVEKK